MPRAVSAIAAAVLLVPLASRPAQAASARPPCPSRYADTLSAMTAASRERESRPSADWVYCLRATAVYEHVQYRRGGKLVHEYVTKIRHGTGFGIRQRGGEWLVATNQHVVAFPEVTGDGQDLDGVPAGSRRVQVEIRIVANEADPESPSQPVLRPVIVDQPLDIAVLASRTPLRIMPYRIGHSADLRVGNAVLARGYPLGAFPAANAGRVIGLGQRDVERGWDHEDFAVDALLNLGSSGSPVLAVACASGEPELVGVYHAGYRNAQGLNVVIAVDQLRSVLEDLQAPVRPVAADVPDPDPAEARAALRSGPVLFPFGGRTIRAEHQGEAVRFSVLDAAFPLSTRVELSVLDRGAPAGGRAAELRAALWAQLGLVLRFRAVDGTAAARVSGTRDRLVARIQQDDDDQQELLAALRVGADGFAQITRADRDPAARGAGETQRPAALPPVEVILGSR